MALGGRVGRRRGCGGNDGFSTAETLSQASCQPKMKLNQESMLKRCWDREKSGQVRGDKGCQEAKLKLFEPREGRRRKGRL